MALTFGHRALGKPDGSTSESWHPYICGHCGTSVSGAVIALVGDGSGRYARWLQCPKCSEGSFCSLDDRIFPGAKFGPLIEGLPKEVAEAYEESRDCLAVNATAACELLCRKILMHVAVDKEAKEGQTFASYVDYLEKEGYVTPPMRDWVKLIKDHGNESTHRLPSPERKRAEGTLLFTAQLLRTVYEMGHLASQFIPKPPTPPAGS